MNKIQITEDTFQLLCKHFVDRNELSALEEKDIEAELYLIRRDIEKHDPRKADKPRVNGERVYFDVFYGDKAEAKATGAKWDKDLKLWYAIEGSEVCDKMRMIFEVKEVDNLFHK